jgi:hypothetical protein
MIESYQSNRSYLVFEREYDDCTAKTSSLHRCLFLRISIAYSIRIQTAVFSEAYLNSTSKRIFILKFLFARHTRSALNANMALLLSEICRLILGNLYSCRKSTPSRIELSVSLLLRFSGRRVAYENVRELPGRV